MQIIKDDNGTILALYCERNSYGNFFMYRESDLLAEKLIAVFGLDDEEKELYNFISENEKPANTIRKWTKNDIIISLEKSEKQNWGHFLCLRVDFGKI